MNSNKLTIQINKPLSEVFSFTLDPKNTPKWAGSIKEEKTNEWPPKLCTIYTNTSDGQNWSKYKLTEFVEDKAFTMTKDDHNYNVQYTFTEVDRNTTKLEYFEWMTRGELEDPFTQDALQKLKEAVEKQHV